MFNWFKKEKYYIVDIEFAKDKRCNVFRSKYSKHKGDDISNSYIQLTMTLNNESRLLEDCVNFVKKKHPEANNFRIVNIFKL